METVKFEWNRVVGADCDRIISVVVSIRLRIEVDFKGGVTENSFKFKDEKMEAFRGLRERLSFLEKLGKIGRDASRSILYSHIGLCTQSTYRDLGRQERLLFELIKPALLYIFLFSI
ncbi:MAG: hypothetical protein ACP5J9_06045 [Dictyoglomus sp.]